MKLMQKCTTDIRGKTKTPQKQVRFTGSFSLPHNPKYSWHHSGKITIKQYQIFVVYLDKVKIFMIVFLKVILEPGSKVQIKTSNKDCSYLQHCIAL